MKKKEREFYKQVEQKYVVVERKVKNILTGFNVSISILPYRHMRGEWIVLVVTPSLEDAMRIDSTLDNHKEYTTHSTVDSVAVRVVVKDSKHHKQAIRHSNIFSPEEIRKPGDRLGAFSNLTVDEKGNLMKEIERQSLIDRIKALNTKEDSEFTEPLVNILLDMVDIIAARVKLVDTTPIQGEGIPNENRYEQSAEKCT